MKWSTSTSAIYPFIQDILDRRKYSKFCVAAFQQFVVSEVVQASAPSLYGRGLELGNLYGPFQRKPFDDSVCIRQLLRSMAIK